LLADSLYKNWWEPPDEIIKIKPVDNKATRRRVDESKSSEAVSTSSAISYSSCVFWSVPVSLHNALLLLSIKQDC